MRGEIPGYKIEEKIYESARTEIYRGIRLSDYRRVIIKTLTGEFLENHEVERLKNEFHLLHELNLPGTIRVLGLETYGAFPLLIMDDFGGNSLQDLMNTRTFSLKQKLEMMLDITRIIGQVHNNHVIHKDIVLSNIIMNPSTKQVKIIDFGISTKLSRQEMEIVNPRLLEGTLSYISPEQTGRMNRPIDYRTDYYSLGVVFYRVLTGRLPFESVDPLELVHCHIAKIPVPPHVVNPDIPHPLSNIIVKLMAKTPEDRYRSNYGLLRDLEQCYSQIKTGNIDDFKIGHYDIPEKFEIPGKLYGREKEIRVLADIFIRISTGGKEAIYFNGAPGIGKSSLIYEIYKLHAEKHGYFGSGKYEQHGMNIPYLGIIRAFEVICKQILSESDAKLDQLKNEILQAVGTNGAIITRLIPELELITGKQNAAPELPPLESKYRFNAVFQGFVQALAQREHPLVIFLDDLQWVDSASLELVQALLEDNDIGYFLFIGAYRDLESNKNHPLWVLQEKLKNQGLMSSAVQVEPIQENHIAKLIADTLYCNPHETLELAAILFQKTGGNPFFLKEYLKTLYERGFFQFSHPPGSLPHWTWDLAKIRGSGITDNVVELMAEKLKKMPDLARDILKTTCCIGTSTPFSLLVLLCSKTKKEILDILKEPIDTGIMIITGSELKFVHHRVWEAAYSLIDEEERKKLHYSFGKKMMGETGGNEKEIQAGDEMIFHIADQWNQVKELLSEDEKQQLCVIDYKAGQKAKSSSAYLPAVNFFRQGAGFFSSSSWDNNYSFTLSYHMEWSQSEYMARHVKEAEQLFDIIMQNARGLLERVNVYSSQIDHYITQTRYDKALEAGMKAFDQLGIPFPEKPGQLSVIINILKAAFLYRNKKSGELLKKQELSDPKKIAAMDIMLKCIPASVIAQPNFAPLLAVKMIEIAVKYGNSAQGAYAYEFFGLILADMGDIANGTKFCELGLKLAEKFNIDSIKSKVYFLFGFLALHLKHHLKQSKQFFTKTQESALPAGDFLYLGYAYYGMGGLLLYSGENLKSIDTDFFQKYRNPILKLNQPHTAIYYNLFHQAILNLMGETENFTLLKGSVFDEEKIIPIFRETKDEAGMVQYYVIKQYLFYLAGDFSQTLDISMKCEILIDKKVILGASDIQVFYFFYALALSALYPSGTKKNKKTYLRKLKTIRKKFKKWGHYCKANYLHKYFLICAEINRITGKKMGETSALYERAVQLAGENEMIHDEAMSCELAGLYFRSKNLEKIAECYMSDARDCYYRWGCSPKVLLIDAKYPHIIHKNMNPVSRGTPVTHESRITVSTSKNMLGLDLQTILKAAATISQEIILDKLLEKLMDLTIENAGAQTGYFLLPHGEKWLIEAEKTVDQKNVHVLQSIPIEPEPVPGETYIPRLPVNIVKYVERTGETVVLNDAGNESNFTRDPYIQLKKPRSLMCMPLMNQGKLTAVLYLENNLTSNAFTPERLNILHTISSHMAISIENARMYRDLDELNMNLDRKVQERTRELNEKNNQIMDSLRYSERIQNVVLPSKNNLNRVFLDHFIIFLPRDIVSGDFYWLSEIQHYTFIAVVDCTGHGIPGSLLSMMGDIFLKEIINSNFTLEPAKILEELHKKVRIHLKQEEKSSRTMDGMDTVLCRIDRKSNRLVFAGAKRPLYIARKITAPTGNADTELIEIPGDKKTIGGRQKETNRSYINHEIEIHKNDTVYLASDGFADQPAPNGKKFGSRRFKTFLASIADFPMETQKRFIKEELKTHQASEKQRDDVTIIGIRF